MPKLKKSGKSPARTPQLIRQTDADYAATHNLYGLVDIRTKDDLEYTYTIAQQKREFELLEPKIGDINSKQSSNRIVLSNQPHYYEIEKNMWKDNKNGLRGYIVNNRKQHLDKYKNEYELTDKDILRGFKISGKHIGFTHFNPLWARWYVERYNIDSIYDPCGGWGHRLLGLSKISKYIYNDFDQRTVDGCKQITALLGITNTTFYCKDSSSFTPAETYDSVFTCPPYYNTETYNNKTFKSKDDYYNWWDKTVKCSLKPTVKFFSYVINHIYFEKLQNICEKNGLVYLADFQVGKALGHFSRSRHKMSKAEYLVVYKNK